MKNFTLFLILIFCFTIVNAQVDEGLILHYEFENSIEDISGNENDALGNTVTYTTDRFGNENSAILFDGSLSILEMPTSDLLLDSYSYSLWTKINTIPTIGNTKFLLSIGQLGGDQTIQVFNQGGSTNNLTGWYGGGYSTDGSILRILDEQLPSIDEWYHIVLTRNVNQLKLYINCTLIDSISTQIFPYYGTSSNYSAKLGGRFNLAESYDGIIDDFRIYDRILSEEEITILCQLTTTTDNKIVQKNIKAYPNPNSSGILSIESNDINKFDKIELINTMGQKVLDKPTQFETTISLSLNHLDSGIYFLNLKNKGTIVSRKKIIITD